MVLLMRHVACFPLALCWLALLPQISSSASSSSSRLASFRRSISPDTATSQKHGVPPTPLLKRVLSTSRGGSAAGEWSNPGTSATSNSASTTTSPAVRGGSSDDGDSDDSGSRGINLKILDWDVPVGKLAIVLGAVVVQQTLTRIVDARQQPRLPPPKDDETGPPAIEAASTTTAAAIPPPPPLPPVVSQATAALEETTEALQSIAPASGTALGTIMEEEEESALDGATMPEHIFNMVKGIVGVGVLSLPAGIAAFANAKSAILPAVALVTMIGILSAIGFSWTGQVCAAMADDETCETSTPSYRQAWSYSVSEESSWIPAMSATAMTFIACLCFSMVLADSLTDLIKPVVAGAGRTSILWTTTCLILLPLCWMKELKSLAPFSVLGVLGMFYTSLAMAGRYITGGYNVGSSLLEKMPKHLHPSFGNDGWKAVFKPSSVILVSMLSTAYMCHYNAPKFYNELRDKTIPRFNTVVAVGFGISILLTAFIACIGFATFGSNSSGFVLNNYASNDVWMSLSRVAVAVALTFSYPLCFQGLREGMLDVIQVPPEERSTKVLNVTTVGLLLALTLLATVLTDVSVVVALTGATLGNLLCYIYPAAMYGRVNPRVKAAAILLGTAGVVLGVIGVKLALESM